MKLSELENATPVKLSDLEKQPSLAEQTVSGLKQVGRDTAMLPAGIAPGVGELWDRIKQLPAETQARLRDAIVPTIVSAGFPAIAGAVAPVAAGGIGAELASAAGRVGMAGLGSAAGEAARQVQGAINGKPEVSSADAATKIGREGAMGAAIAAPFEAVRPALAAGRALARTTTDILAAAPVGTTNTIGKLPPKAFAGLEGAPGEGDIRSWGQNVADAGKAAKERAGKQINAAISAHDAANPGGSIPIAEVDQKLQELGGSLRSENPLPGTDQPTLGAYQKLQTMWGKFKNGIPMLDATGGYGVPPKSPETGAGYSTEPLPPYMEPEVRKPTANSLFGRPDETYVEKPAVSIERATGVGGLQKGPLAPTRGISNIQAGRFDPNAKMTLADAKAFLDRSRDPISFDATQPGAVSAQSTRLERFSEWLRDRIGQTSPETDKALTNYAGVIDNSNTVKKGLGVTSGMRFGREDVQPTESRLTQLLRERGGRKNAVDAAMGDLSPENGQALADRARALAAQGALHAPEGVGTSDNFTVISALRAATAPLVRPVVHPLAQVIETARVGAPSIAGAEGVAGAAQGSAFADKLRQAITEARQKNGSK